MALAGTDWERLNVDPERMGEHVREASELLKAPAHEGRLLILCDLSCTVRSRLANWRPCCLGGNLPCAPAGP